MNARHFMLTITETGEVAMFEIDPADLPQTMQLSPVEEGPIIVGGSAFELTLERAV